MGDAEAAARALFASEQLAPASWSNGPGDRYPAHEHSYDKVLVCVAGSIVFHLDDRDVELAEGDRLDLAAGTTHAATVGPDGVVCWEGHR